jgi:hypothetical protein
VAKVKEHTERLPSVSGSMAGGCSTTQYVAVCVEGGGGKWYTGRRLLYRMRLMHC